MLTPAALIGGATITLACVTMVTMVAGHGLMVDPPARNTIWRLGFNNPVNYDDMGLNCGGLDNQWRRNNGKCGVCGDPYQGPLKHQAGFPGGYANGIIGKHYKRGQTITVKTKITANHKGYLMFKICPVNNPNVKVTQNCLDRYPLVDSKGRKRVYISNQIGNAPGIVTARLQLPKHLTCKQCVIQWTYTAGNNHGPEDTTPQETFVNCADVKITTLGGPQPIPPKITIKTINYKTDEFGMPIKDKAWDCELVAPYNVGQNVKRNYKWCINNCITAVPLQRSCPPHLCKCYTVPIIVPSLSTTVRPKTTPKGSGKRDPKEWECEVTLPYAGGSRDQVASLTRWCTDSCILAEPRFRQCPSNMCNCYKVKDVSTTTQQPVVITTGKTIIPSEWTCDLVSPYNVGSNTHKLRKWCVDNCIKAHPRDRNCPPTHCDCYKKSRQQSVSSETEDNEQTPSSGEHFTNRIKFRTARGYCTLVSMRDERSLNSRRMREWCANSCLLSSSRCPTHKCNCVRR